MNTKRLAKRIVIRLLDIGLYKSSWREKHPIAYGDLLDYREDMEISIIKVLNKKKE